MWFVSYLMRHFIQIYLKQKYQQWAHSSCCAGICKTFSSFLSTWCQEIIQNLNEIWCWGRLFFHISFFHISFFQRMPFHDVIPLIICEVIRCLQELKKQPQNNPSEIIHLFLHVLLRAFSERMERSAKSSSRNYSWQLWQHKPQVSLNADHFSLMPPSGVKII